MKNNLLSGLNHKVKSNILKFISKGQLFAGESGQSAVLIVLTFSLILGCSALVVDLGADHRVSMKMQNAADMAALAAAKQLPDIIDTKSKGVEIAVANGAEEEGVSVNTPYDGDSTKVEVICTKENSHGFARIFGSDSAVLSGRSVAQMIPPKWAGAALPLLNVEGYDVGNGITIWEKNSPGNFGVLYRKKMVWIEGDGDTPGHFQIEYENGVYVENGKIGSLKDEIEEMCAEGRTVFIFSLSNDALLSGYDLKQNLHQGSLVDKEYLVLLKCTVSSYDFKSLELTVDEIYDIYGNAGEAQIPEDFVFVAGGCGSAIVE